MLVSESSETGVIVISRSHSEVAYVELCMSLHGNESPYEALLMHLVIVELSGRCSRNPEGRHLLV